MGTVGALQKTYAHKAHSEDRKGLGRIKVPLNLQLPQSERIRRDVAWTLPKNNYTAGTTLRLGQETGPAGPSAVTGTAAGVRVVGDADV